MPAEALDRGKVAVRRVRYKNYPLPAFLAGDETISG